MSKLSGHASNFDQHSPKPVIDGSAYVRERSPARPPGKWFAVPVPSSPPPGDWRVRLPQHVEEQNSHTSHKKSHCDVVFQPHRSHTPGDVVQSKLEWFLSQAPAKSMPFEKRSRAGWKHSEVIQAPDWLSVLRKLASSEDRARFVFPAAWCLRSLESYDPHVHEVRNWFMENLFADVSCPSPHDASMNVLAKLIVATRFPYRAQFVGDVTFIATKRHRLWRLPMSNMPGFIPRVADGDSLYSWAHATSEAGALCALLLGVVLPICCDALGLEDPQIGFFARCVIDMHSQHRRLAEAVIERFCSIRNGVGPLIFTGMTHTQHVSVKSGGVLAELKALKKAPVVHGSHRLAVNWRFTAITDLWIVEECERANEASSAHSRHEMLQRYSGRAVNHSRP